MTDLPEAISQEAKKISAELEAEDFLGGIDAYLKRSAAVDITVKVWFDLQRDELHIKASAPDPDPAALTGPNGQPRRVTAEFVEDWETFVQRAGSVTSKGRQFGRDLLVKMCNGTGYEVGKAPWYKVVETNAGWYEATGNRSVARTMAGAAAMSGISASTAKAAAEIEKANATARALGRSLGMVANEGPSLEEMVKLDLDQKAAIKSIGEAAQELS